MVELGDKSGRWAVHAVASVVPRRAGKSGVLIEGECKCGERTWLSVSDFRRRRPCPHCSSKVPAHLKSLGPAWDAADTVPADMDPTWKEMVRRKRGEWTLDEIAIAWGKSRERIRQVESEALAKLRRECEAIGIDVHTVVAMLVDAPGDANGNAPDNDWCAGVEVGVVRPKGRQPLVPRGWLPKVGEKVGARTVESVSTIVASDRSRMRVALRCPECDTTTTVDRSSLRRGRGARCGRCVRRKQRMVFSENAPVWKEASSG